VPRHLVMIEGREVGGYRNSRWLPPQVCLVPDEPPTFVAGLGSIVSNKEQS
jgi:hypothetical protein